MAVAVRQTAEGKCNGTLPDRPGRTSPRKRGQISQSSIVIITSPVPRHASSPVGHIITFIRTHAVGNILQLVSCLTTRLRETPMKFGKQLEKVMDISDPEWGACAREFARKPVRALSARARAPGTHAAPFFIRYSVLKHMIKDIVSETTPDAGEPYGCGCGSTSLSSGARAPRVSARWWKCCTPGVAAHPGANTALNPGLED